MERKKLWTGPVDVTHCAASLRRMGYKNVMAGTEYVYFDGPEGEKVLDIEKKMYSEISRYRVRHLRDK